MHAFDPDTLRRYGCDILRSLYHHPDADPTDIEHLLRRCQRACLAGMCAIPGARYQLTSKVKFQRAFLAPTFNRQGPELN